MTEVTRKEDNQKSFKTIIQYNAKKLKMKLIASKEVKGYKFKHIPKTVSSKNNSSRTPKLVKGSTKHCYTPNKTLLRHMYTGCPTPWLRPYGRG